MLEMLRMEGHAQIGRFTHVGANMMMVLCEGRSRARTTLLSHQHFMLELIRFAEVSKAQL